jgi:aminocarboxymuconate-semialdehyde decarboxylase
VDTLGEDQVMVGSDYPYPLGERPVGEVVRRADFLSEDQQVKLLSENALRFLGSKRRSDE